MARALELLASAEQGKWNMDDVTISKHFKNGRHVGFKKFVYGKNHHLVTGTTPADERKAKAIASVLVERGERLRRVGGAWTKAVIDECFGRFGDEAPVITGIPVEPVVAPAQPAVDDVQALPQNLWLYQVMEKYKDAERLRAKGKKISHTHAVNNVYRIEWAKDGISDRPMQPLSLPEIKAWVSHFSSRPRSERYQRPISPYSACGIIRCIRHFLDFCDAEGYWKTRHRWLDAFKGISVKKLMSSLEKNRQKREGFLNLALREAQILWHLSVPDTRALFGLALWAGHTQNELATVLLEGEFIEKDGELFLERDRHKTGVWGKWWIPPEVAAVVRARMARTPTDVQTNPWQIAFLTTNQMPLVHFGMNNDKARSDSVQQMWSSRLRAAVTEGVRHVPFKYLRKTMAQQVRNRLGVEYSTLFSAQKVDPISLRPTLDNVQDEFYTNGCFEKLEKCMREDIYPFWKKMFEPVNWEELATKKLPPPASNDNRAA